MTMTDLFDRVALARDYRETFATPHGNRVLNHLLKVSGVTHPRFTLDSQQLLWNEAQRHLVLSIFRMARGSPDHLANQIEEQIKQQEQKANEHTA